MAEDENELSLKQGSIVNVIDSDFEGNDWIEGYTEDETGIKHGFFPKSFVRLLADGELVRSFIVR